MSKQTKTVEADQAWAIEQHGIEPIPLADRHGRALELLKLWVGANTNYVVVVTGALVISLNLSFTAAIAAIIVGNVLGCIVLGLASIMGPRSGTSGIMTSRSSFGQIGSFFPKVLNVASALSWFSINSILATQALSELFAMAGYSNSSAIWVALLIILFLEIVLAIYGHATIIKSESYLAVALGVIFCGMTFFVLQHLSVHALFVAKPFSVLGWLTAVSLIFSYPMGWSNYASDYSRYFPASMSWKKIAFSAGAGQFVAVTICEIIGVMLAISVGGNLGSDPVAQFSASLPTWFVIPLLLGIVFGGVAANVPNGYTSSLGMLALRIPVNRIYSLLIIAVFTLLFRCVVIYYNNFFNAYQTFLSYMAFWTAPWAAIVVVDYFMRDGRYQTDEWMKWRGSAYWYQSGVFWPGLVAFIIGIATCFAFSNSSTFVDPLMSKLGIGDISYEMGCLIAGVAYYALARKTLKLSTAEDKSEVTLSPVPASTLISEGRR